MAQTGIAHAELAKIARRFVRARLSNAALAEYPGNMPPTLAAAYAIQDAAIAEWPDDLRGWKVGRILEPWLARFGAGRLVGPIFARGIREARDSRELGMPMFAGGFAAVEAEFIVRLAADAPADKTIWSAQEAGEMAGDLFAGVEPAGSPLAPINDLGPVAIVSDFGNNAGLILGPAIPGWRERRLDQLTTETFIDGQSVGQGTAASVPGGPLAALAFALGSCARRGLPLKAGHFVSTGATTGVHQIRPGQRARVVFGGIGEINLVAGDEPC
jgi:2-keto-4-pentenoate hydratase